MTETATRFSMIDWGVIAAYLIFTTYLGHKLSGKQSTIRDFFLGGRKLPWLAVSGSIIATEISALTFIGVPALVFAAGGNFTYLQWAIGSIIARFIVGIVFTRVFYEREIYSPYDYMEHRLGGGVKKLTTFLFFIGTILGQSVRLLVTAIILHTVIPSLSMGICIVLLSAFAILWTWIGGMTTVIWTDVIQFFIFVFSAVLALIWIPTTIDGGWSAIWQAGQEAGKFKLLDLTTNPALEFTLWVGIFAMPFQNMAAFGTDQLNAQRMFCCKSASDAGKAMIASCIGQIVTILMLFVGVGLFAYYRQHPPTEAQAALFAQDGDYVFPVWITTVLPTGVAGLALAGAFAAAISSLESVLAALSQTSLSLYYGQEGLHTGDHKKMVTLSRILVVIWGIALAFTAVGLNHMRDGVNMIQLAFGMVSYTYGPMLGIFLLALFSDKVSMRGIWLGVILSILMTLYVRPDIYTIAENFKWFTAEQVASIRPTLAFPWMYPITCIVTIICGLLFCKKTRTAS